MYEQPEGTILAGYRVLDLTDAERIFVARLLADMGAGVVCLNPAEDDIRNAVKTADILIESALPGYMASLGLGYEDLNKINPGLIMVSITPFGQSGPYREYKSCELVAQALGGWLSVTGEPGAPLKLYGNQSYHTTSLFVANGILLALWQRHTTGKGRYIDISIMECVTATLDHVLARYFYEGIVSGREGGRHWNNAFEIFRCRDGYILLSLHQQWETLAEWLASEGMDDDLTEARWRDRAERNRGVDHIIEVLGRWTLTHKVGELVERGQMMHFPWVEVASEKK
jgi:benzylsuccinate CoA-transferase BbsE subunit